MAATFGLLLCCCLLRASWGQMYRLSTHSPNATEPPVIIATSLPLDCCSRYSTFGTAMRQSYEVFLDRMSELYGGIPMNGTVRRLEMVIINDNSEHDQVREIYDFFLNEMNLRLLMSTYGSSLGLVAATEVNRTNAVMVAPCSASPTVFVGRPNVYSSVSPSTTYLSGPLQAIEHVRRVSYLYEDVSFTRGVCASVPEFAEAHGIEVGHAIMVSEDAGSEEIAAACVELSENPPDALVGCVYINACHRLIEAMRVLSLDIPAVLLTTCIGDPSFADTGASGTFFTGAVPWLSQFTFWSEDSRWTGADFSRTYEAKFKLPPMYQSATAQAGLQNLVGAIMEVGSTDPDEVSRFMKTMRRDTVLGNIGHDANGQGTVPFKAVQVTGHDEPLAIVAPRDLADAEFVYPMPSWNERKCNDPDTSGLHEFGYDSSQTCRECGSSFVSLWSNETQNRQCVPLPSSSISAGDTSDAGEIVLIVLGTVGCLLFLALLGYGVYRARKYIKEKRKLEALREKLVQEHIETALRTTTHLMHPMVLIAAETFAALSLQDLRACYEGLRNKGYLVMLDDGEAINNFKSAGKKILFFSYERLYWWTPGPNEDQHLAMLSAMQEVQKCLRDGEELYIWLDILCIPQKHVDLKSLAVSSLYAFASHADMMVAIAPNSYHKDAQFASGTGTIKERVWVRVEQVFYIAKKSRSALYVQTQDSFSQVPATWLEDIAPVFEAQMTCCRLGHPGGLPCDREQLVVCLLGLYFDLLMKQKEQQLSDGGVEVKSIFDTQKDRIFPKKFTYTQKQGPPVRKELFGDMVARMEKYVDGTAGEVLASNSVSPKGSVFSGEALLIPVPLASPVRPEPFEI